MSGYCKDKGLKIAYKFRIYPDNHQQELLAKQFGCCRFIWNRMLSDKKFFYEQMGETLNVTPADYKDEFPWLKEVDSLGLANVQLILDRAYKAFFSKKAKFPRFKSKDQKQSYTTNCVRDNIRLEAEGLRLPKLGVVRIIRHRKIRKSGVLKSVTVSKDTDGRYYASILFSYPDEEPASTLDRTKAIGLDMSMKELYRDSNDYSPKFPKPYRKSEAKLKQLQKGLSKMQKGSNNYKKQKRKISSLHAKAKRQRQDFLHKESFRIIRENDYIFLEDIDLRAMSGCLNLGKSVHDNGFGTFRNQLAYKAAWNGKVVYKVSRYFPSSKTCSSCGYIHKELKLSDRTYICPACGNIMDRDYNAARNILEEGLRCCI